MVWFNKGMRFLSIIDSLRAIQQSNIYTILEICVKHPIYDVTHFNDLDLKVFIKSYSFIYNHEQLVQIACFNYSAFSGINKREIVFNRGRFIYSLKWFDIY